MKKQLITLNLALVLLVNLVLCAPTAFAAGNDEINRETISQAAGFCGRTVSQSAEAGLQADLMSSTPYRITVNGTSFFSDETKSGTGWSYDADGSLDLTDYSGSSVTASGDLAIYSNGTVNITGGTSGAYGSNGVSVSGTLDFFVLSGTATIRGGAGTVYGGCGVAAVTMYLVASDANFICTGGEGNTQGGEGIYGNFLGLYARHATIKGGGSPSAAGFGIVYGDFLEFGPGYITVQAGSSSVYAIATTGSDPWYYSIYTDLTNEGYRITLIPKTFTLTLNGNGGLYNGSSTVPLSGPFPQNIELENYIFTRSGYQQVGWVTGSDFLPIEYTYLPTADTTLKASWVAVSSNSVLFIGNGGLINGNYYSLATTGSSVAVPSRAEAKNTSEYGASLYLLGWTDHLNLTTDDGSLLNGSYKWFLPGSAAKIESQSTLYAKWTLFGNIIYYEGNGGYTGSGSGAMVQAKLVSGSDLTLNVQDGTKFQRSGYTFAGWKDQFGNPFSAGQPVAATADLCVTNLTAQWARNYTLTLNGNGGKLGGASTSVIPSYDGKTEDLSSYPYNQSGCTLTGWNTKQDGTGTSYPAAGSVTVTGDTTLYAQWEYPSQTYVGRSADLKDSVTCVLTPALNRVQGSLSVTSLKNATPNPVQLSVLYALYQGDRLVSVVAKEVQLTGTGLTDTATISYAGGVQPDSCKVFLLDGADYAPAGPPIVCALENET